MVLVNTSDHSVLQAGETFRYPYVIVVTSAQPPVDVVRIDHVVNISNGQAPEMRGSQNISLGAMSTTEKDAQATMTDQLSIPARYSGQLNDSGPWQLSDNASLTVSLNLSNVDASTSVSVVNSAQLSESDSGDVRDGSASVRLTVTVVPPVSNETAPAGNTSNPAPSTGGNTSQ
jgi:hypothetical protein